MRKATTKTCVWCGKTFETTVNNKKHCCRKCEILDYKNGGQLCWKCQYATGGCLWSGFYIPIKGWDATPVIVKEEGYKDIHTYHIKFCPLL